jgi:hypothetical protein
MSVTLPAAIDDLVLATTVVNHSAVTVDREDPGGNVRHERLPMNSYDSGRFG